MRRAILFAALVVACGGQKTQTTAPPRPSATAVPVVTADLDAGAEGRIDPGTVRQIVRAGAPHFMLCYAEGLKKKRDLAGRVETKFVIDETGHVISTEDVTHSNVLPDDGVRACILSKFRNLEFPPPNPSGKVTITYPLLLDPSMVATQTTQTDAGTETVVVVDPHVRAFDPGAVAGVLGTVDLKPCGRAGGFHGQGHMKVTFEPDGHVSKVEVDSPASAQKTAAAACVVKAYSAAHVPGFDGHAVTVGKNFRVP